MKRRGVDELFFAGTPLETIVGFVQRSYGRPRQGRERGELNELKRLHELHKEGTAAYETDRRIAKWLIAAEARAQVSNLESQHSTVTVGIAGPGGAGKSALL